MIKKIPIKERVALLMFLAVIITNPLTSQFVVQGILLVFDELVKYGNYVILVAASYGMALVFWHIFQLEETKTKPKATKKPKNGMKYELSN